MHEGQCADWDAVESPFHKVKIHALPPPKPRPESSQDTLRKVVFGLWVTPGQPSMMAMSWAKEAAQEILGSRWHALTSELQAGLILTLVAPFEGAFFRTSGLTYRAAVSCFPDIYVDLLQQRIAIEISAMDGEVLAGRTPFAASKAGGELLNEILEEIDRQARAVFEEARQVLEPVLVDLAPPGDLDPSPPNEAAPKDNVRQLFPTP